MRENFKKWLAEQDRDPNAGYWIPQELIEELRKAARPTLRRSMVAKIFDDDSLYPPEPDGPIGNNGPQGTQGLPGIY